MGVALKEDRRVEASGRASLYTWSIVRHNDLPPFNERVPYVAAVVDLDEGPRMMTNVVDCAFDELEADMPLEVVYEEISDDPFVKPPPCIHTITVFFVAGFRFCVQTFRYWQCSLAMK